MKILAVIPARAGSKSIPNKNIRIIGGHPLV
ncbi:MAG: acylneuraminate cytidylyltransferase family protein, partial [Prevotella sp.]|nr:acylneuraminate cytidylyltransferase family protein [Prevotella sp.]